MSRHSVSSLKRARTKTASTTFIVTVSMVLGCPMKTAGSMIRTVKRTGSGSGFKTSASDCAGRKAIRSKRPARTVIVKIPFPDRAQSKIMHMEVTRRSSGEVCAYFFCLYEGVFKRRPVICSTFSIIQFLLNSCFCRKPKDQSDGRQ